MSLPRDIIVRWHEKLTASTQRNFQDLRAVNGQDFKPHSLFTILTTFTVILTLDLVYGVGLFDHAYSRSIALFLKVLMIPAGITLCVLVIYNWHAFLRLRRVGTITDKNLFFSESARAYRKGAFYISLAIDVLRKVQNYFDPETMGQRLDRLKYQSRSDVYQEAGLSLLDSIILSVLFIECLRILLPKLSGWSDTKHAGVVVAMSLSIALLKVSVLQSVSGHGIL